jgi:hypothetical protein
MIKGKSGQQIAQENLKLVQAWINERNAARDWDEYEYSGKVNRRVLAEELGFAKSVCTQNKAVRTLIEEADGYWFRKIDEDKKSHEAARERAEKQTNMVSMSNNALTQRIVELEAENRQLQRELTKFKKQQNLVQAGAAGFKI